MRADPAVILNRTVRAMLVSLAILTGCSATPEATHQRDAEAKLFDSTARAAVIYLYRGDSPGSNGVSTVWVDGRLVGQTLPGTYFRVIARPGRNLVHATGADGGRLALQTRENDVYYVAMHVTGEGEGSSNTVFRSVSPAAGQAEIQRCCSMLETWRPGQWRLPL